MKSLNIVFFILTHKVNQGLGDQDEETSCDQHLGCTETFKIDPGLKEPKSKTLQDIETNLFRTNGEVLNQILDFQNKLGPNQEGLYAESVILKCLSKTIIFLNQSLDATEQKRSMFQDCIEDLDILINLPIYSFHPATFKRALVFLKLALQISTDKDGGESQRNKLCLFIFNQGKIFLFQDCLLWSRFGDTNTQLSSETSPNLVIKSILIRAVSLLSAETGEEGDEEVCKIQEGQEQNCKHLTSAKNEGKTAGINTITHVFWDDRMRSKVHGKLEWWIAKSEKMGYMNLVENIYRAGVESGIYLSRYQRPINAIQGLTAKPVWRTKDLNASVRKALATIRENWKLIRDEALDLMKINRRIWAVDPGWQGMKGSRGAWSEVAIKGVALATSQEQTRLCQHALFSCRLIQKFSEARGCPKCKASFSLIKPGTVIPAHAGPTNSRLRAHLGLIIPKGDLYMKIGNQTVGWKPGQWTIIDDSFQHEVVNDSKGDRLILIVDFRHPEVGEDSENEFSFSKEKMKSSGLEREDVISSGFLPPENNLE